MSRKQEKRRPEQYCCSGFLFAKKPGAGRLTLDSHKKAKNPHVQKFPGENRPYIYERSGASASEEENMTFKDLLIIDYFAVMGMYFGGQWLKDYLKKKRKSTNNAKEREEK